MQGRYFPYYRFGRTTTFGQAPLPTIQPPIVGDARSCPQQWATKVKFIFQPLNECSPSWICFSDSFYSPLSHYLVSSVEQGPIRPLVKAQDQGPNGALKGAGFVLAGRNHTRR